MSLVEQIQKDLTAAMKSHDELRLSVLRMVKSALKNKEIEKKRPLEDAEAIQMMQTLIKQRKESAEQFEKGGRRELAEKEIKEISVIEAYLPCGEPARMRFAMPSRRPSPKRAQLAPSRWARSSKRRARGWRPNRWTANCSATASANSFPEAPHPENSRENPLRQAGMKRGIPERLIPLSARILGSAIRNVCPGVCDTVAVGVARQAAGCWNPRSRLN